MMRIRVEFMGGPLDGAVNTVECAEGDTLNDRWLGPDPTRSKTHVIAYSLDPDDPRKTERKILFDPNLTRFENLQRGQTY